MVLINTDSQLSKLYYFDIIRAFTYFIFYFNGILTNFVVKHRFNLRTTYDTSRANIRRHKQLSVMYWTCKKKHLFCHNYYRELFVYFFLVLPHQKVLACKMEFCVKQKRLSSSSCENGFNFLLFKMWQHFQSISTLHKTKTCWYRCFVAINLCAIFLLQQRYFC